MTEERGKRPRVAAAVLSNGAPLRLDRFIPIRDVRKLIWRHLTPADREVVRRAHNSLHNLDCRALVIHCCANGHLALLQWAYSPAAASKEMLIAAGHGAHIAILRWLYDVGAWSKGGKICSAAAANGHTNVLDYVDKEGGDVPWIGDSETWRKAAGHLPVLKWVWEQRYDPASCFGDAVAIDAAAGGHMDVLEWLADIGASPIPSGVYVAAAANSHMNVLQWALARNIPYDPTDLACACAHNVELVRWAHGLGVVPPPVPFHGGNYWTYAAGLGGSDAVVRFAAEELHVTLNWAQVAEEALENADNCMPVVQYAISRQPAILTYPSLCQSAVCSAHTYRLCWLRSQGANWDASVCVSAAECGFLQILQWLRARGCPWDENTCTRAAAFGHLDVIEWAYANGCPCDLQAVHDHGSYARNDGICQWAEDHGLPE